MAAGHAALERRVAELEALVRQQQTQITQLRERLNRNASNSSLPPLLPPQRVRHITDHVPSHCQRCHTPLPHQPTVAEPPPTRFQVVELPTLTALV